MVRIDYKALETNRELLKMKLAINENTIVCAAIEGSLSGLKRISLSILKVRGKTGSVL